MVYVLLFLFGLAIGSFLNVLVLRVNTGISLRGRSRCFSCLKKLAWYDLVPLFSYLHIRGRCRYCGSSVSLQYPVVELLSGTLFASTLLVFPHIGSAIFIPMNVAQYFVTSFFFATLLAISVYDARHKIIPDQFSIALFVFALLSGALYLLEFGSFEKATWLGNVAAALGSFIFFAGVWLLSKGKWMGFGDAKLSFSLGLFLGFPGIFVAFLVAVWAGTLYGIFMMFFGGYNMKTEVPFAPFLAFGAYAAFLLLWSPAASFLFKYVTVI